MTTAADELAAGVPRSVPPPIARAHMNEEARPRRVSAPEPDYPPDVSAPVAVPWELVRDLAGVALIALGCLGGDVLAFAYAGPAYGAGVLCALAVVAGVVLGRI